MAINQNRPVISYENIALFQSSSPADNADSNSGQNISFLPLVQGINFSIDVGRTNAGALGTKDFIDQSNRSAPNVNLSINTLENFGHLFSDLISGLNVEGGLNTDKNFYAVLGPKRAFDISRDSVMGKETLGFGNCFLNNISISQSAKGLLSSEYTYVGSNVQAETLTNSLAATNLFITKDDSRVIFVYNSETFAESATSDGGILLNNGRPQYSRVGIFLQNPLIFWDSDNNYWVKYISQFPSQSNPNGDPSITILNNGEDTPYPYLALDNTIRSEYTVTPAIGSAPSLNLTGNQSQSVACSFDPMPLYYTNDADGVIPSYETSVSISGSSSFGNFLIRSDSIQSFDLNLPINRKSIYSLGKKYPVKRKALFPSAGSFSFSNLVSSFELNGDMANLKDFLSSDEDYTIDVAGENTKGEDFHVRIEEAKLVSQSQTSSIGENISANLGFSFELNNLKKFNLLERFPGAIAAYSLRDLNGTMGNNPVVDVRRDNDGVIQAFSAKEITDGTLTSWAKLNLPQGELGTIILSPSNHAFVTKWYDQSSSVTSVYEAYPKIYANSSSVSSVLFTKTDEETFTIQASNSTEPRFITIANASSGLELGKHRITCDVSETVGSVSSAVIGVYADNDAEPNPIPFSYNTFAFSAGSNVIDFEVFDDGQVEVSPPIIQLAIPEETSCNISFSNFKITRVVDESVTQNNNHATQTDATKQPKIVDAGSLIKDSEGRPEIDFNGSDQFFDIDFGSDLSQPNSIFMVHQSDTTNSTDNEFFDEKGVNSQRSLLDVSTNGGNYRMFADTTFTTNQTINTNKNLIAAFYDGTSSFLSKNGTASSAGDVGSKSIAATSSLGFSESVNPPNGHYYDGTMQEFIVYNSNQSTNRIAIEKNIKNYYKINTTDSDGDGVDDNADAFPSDASETTDTDGDGVGDNADAFPSDATETVDTDSDGTGNNADTDDDGDGLSDSDEATIGTNPLLADTDSDGVGDNADVFPSDPTETTDTDGDGVGDNADAFPSDASETTDTDGDGVGDNADAFPSDATETVDTDSDGTGNNADTDDDGDGLSDSDEATIGTNPLLADTDSDGVGDNADVFPSDPTETTDTDGDGVGDNADAFPSDASETTDTDGDGVGDNADAFPSDASETTDTDGDGVGDNADAFPSDASETTDTDGDGVGDNADAFPNDPSRSEAETNNSFRYYRFSGANSDGSFINSTTKTNISEVGLFEDGGTEYPTTALTSNTSETNITTSAGNSLNDANYGPWRAFDHTNEVWYANNASPGNLWMQIDLGQSRDITGISVQAYLKSVFNNADKLVIYASDDSSTFTQIWGSTGFADIPGNSNDHVTIERDLS